MTFSNCKGGLAADEPDLVKMIADECAKNHSARDTDASAKTKPAD